MAATITPEAIEARLRGARRVRRRAESQVARDATLRGARRRLARPRRARADRRGRVRRRAQGRRHAQAQDRRRRDRPGGAPRRMNRAIVITGVGAVTPLGVGARTLHERWRAGQSGIEDGVGAATSSTRPSTCRASRRAARTASRSSRWPRPTRRWPRRAGRTSAVRPRPGRLLIGTGIGGIGTLEANHDSCWRRARRRSPPLSIPLMMGNAASAAVSMRHGLRGQSFGTRLGLRGRRARDRHGRADDPARRRRRGRHRRLRGGAHPARHRRLRRDGRAQRRRHLAPVRRPPRRLRDGRGRRRARARGRRPRPRARRDDPRRACSATAPPRTRTT